MTARISSHAGTPYVPGFDTASIGSVENDVGLTSPGDQEGDSGSLGGDLFASGNSGASSEFSLGAMSLDIAGQTRGGSHLDWLIKGTDEPDQAKLAHDRTEQLFTNANAQKAEVQPDEVVILKDAIDVNQGENNANFTWNQAIVQTNEEQRAKALDLINSNQTLESDALSRLGPDQQAQYETVKAMTSNDPQARLALQTMLIDGRLPGGKLNHEGKDLLGQLSEVSTQKVAAGIDHQALVSDLIQEIQDPDAINQQDKDTCTMTSLQIKVASENPAEYARIVGGLAGPSGDVTLANGDTMSRVPGTEQGDGSPRTQSARLWEAAAMNYAVKGTGSVYSNERDHFVDAKTGQETDPQKDAAFVERVRLAVEGGPALTPHNLKAEAQDAINADLNNGAHSPEAQQLVQIAQSRPLDVNDADAAIESYRQRVQGPKLTEQIKQAVEGGQSILVGINYAKSGNHGEHEVLVKGFEQDAQGKEWVVYNNPWGQVEKMPREDFEKRLLSVAL